MIPQAQGAEMRALDSGPFGDLVILLRYGSNQEEGDKDYLAIYEQQPPTSNAMVGSLDLWSVSMEKACWHLEHLDPFITEPLLTGKLVRGDCKQLEGMKARLRGLQPLPAATTHLLRKAAEAWLRVLDPIWEEDSTSLHRRLFWSTLSFSMSYFLFAREYSSHWRGPLTLQGLVKLQDPQIQGFWEEVVDNKSARRPRDIGMIRRWESYMFGLSEKL